MKMDRLFRRVGALALGAALAAACLCPAAAAAEETEVPQAALPGCVIVSDWALPEVERAYAAGIVPAEMDLGTDYSAGITRRDFAALAVELVACCLGTDTDSLMAEYGLPAQEPDLTEEAVSAREEEPAAEEEGAAEEAAPTFTDTDDPYVLLAARLGIVKGSNIGTFRPEGLLNRAEAAVMIQRCMAFLGRGEANDAPMRFSDAYAIPRWAAEGVKYSSGRTTAAGDALMGGVWGRFMPQDTYSVEQAILTLLRCYESLSVDTVYEGWRQAPGYDTVSITLSFGGDCTFGRMRGGAYAGSFDEMYDKMGPAYFFSNVKEFHSDDLTMINFEGALTTSDTPREAKEFIFKGRPEYARILEEGSVDVACIANNHARDYGDQGLADTIRYLSPYVAVSGYSYQPVLTVKGVKVGFASNLGWSFDASQKQFITDAVANLRAKGAEIIVFNFHWGVERQYTSNATQRAIAHYCIDQGADLVIGHHPHVVQEVETYKGKQIAYSLGNLSFGGNRNPSDKNCLIFQQTFTVGLDSRDVEGSSYRAVPYTVSSVDYRNDYRPTPA